MLSRAFYKQLPLLLRPLSIMSSKVTPQLPDKLVIFDGVCNLCNGTVQFIIERDPAEQFKFVALQSDAAKPMLRHFNISDEDALKSITFVDGGVAYTKSTAAIRIASQLDSPFRYLSIFECLPSLLRDSVYDLVAANRYRIFGQSEVCMRPTKALMARFLDASEMQGSKKDK